MTDTEEIKDGYYSGQGENIKFAQHNYTGSSVTGTGTGFDGRVGH